MEELKERYVDRCLDEGKFLEALIASGYASEVKEVKVYLEKGLYTYQHKLGIALITGNGDRYTARILFEDILKVGDILESLLNHILKETHMVLEKKEK
jgi:hypothetical protein